MGRVIQWDELGFPEDGDHFGLEGAIEIQPGRIKPTREDHVAARVY